ncbi:MAG: hypothetical protein ACOX8Q_01765 [Christensenellales bacterium]|jgi:hypothetical protein
MKKFVFILAIFLCVAIIFVACSGGGSKSEGAATTSIQGGSESPSSSASGSESASSSASGSESPSASAAQMIEPGQLISKKDAEELIGEKVKEGEKKEQPALGLKTCLYSAESQTSKSFLQISIIQQAFLEPETQQTPSSIFDALKQVMSEPNAEAPKIGDEAFMGMPGLYVLSNGYYIGVSSGGSGDQKEILKKAGEKAIENLKRILGQ